MSWSAVINRSSIVSTSLGDSGVWFVCRKFLPPSSGNSALMRTDAASAPEVAAAARNAEILQRSDGELLAVFPDKWGLRVLQQNKPELLLEPLVAAQL